MAGTYAFLLDTYETEILKIASIWEAFPEKTMDYRPHPKSRSVLEQMEHQVQSEGRWMKMMLGIDTGDPNPAQRTKQGFIEKYRADASGDCRCCAKNPTSGGATLRSSLT